MLGEYVVMRFGVKFRLEFSAYESKSTEMQEKIQDMAEMGMSVIPKVRVAVPVGTGVKLEDRLRGVLRVKGLAITTEETYVGWYRRYVKHFGVRHPQEMGARARLFVLA